MPGQGPSIGWGGPSAASVMGDPNAPNALAPSIAAPIGMPSLAAIAAAMSPSSIAAALGAPHGGYAPGSPGAIAHGGTPNTTGMTSAHGWGSAPSSINANLSPQQAADLGYTVSTMNTNQAAINDAIANNAPVSSMENPSSIGQFGYGINSSANALANANQSAPSLAISGYNDAVSAPMGYGYGVNQGQTSAVADALGYSNAVSAPMGYGYGMNLGVDSMNLGNPDEAAPSAAQSLGYSDEAANVAEAQGYSDSQSADTGYGYGVQGGFGYGAPGEDGEDGGDDAGDAGDAGDGGDGGY